MPDEIIQKQESVWKRLTRLFRSGPVVRHKIAAGERLNEPRGTARAYKKELSSLYVHSLASYGQYERLSRYADYSEMEFTPEIASALDIYADETTSYNEQGQILSISTDDEEIKQILETLFFDILNIEYNIWSWTRNLPIRRTTRIPLLDGRNITIEELAREHASGKENWVYSVQDGTQRLVPGKVVWCGRTKEDSVLTRTWLDDGTYVDTTPDHEFVLRDGSRRRADALEPGQSLMPFYRKTSSVAVGEAMDGYEKVYDPATNRYVYTHRRVAEILSEEPLTDRDRHHVTHHVDFDKRNNDPRNLRRIGDQEHLSLHRETAEKILKRPDVVEKRMAGIDRWLRSDKHRKLAREQLRSRNEKGEMLGWSDYNSSRLAREHDVIRSETMKRSWTDPEFRRKNKDAVSTRLSLECLGYIQEVAKTLGGRPSLARLCGKLRVDPEFERLLQESNQKKVRGSLKQCLNSPQNFGRLISRESGVSYAGFLFGGETYFSRGKPAAESVSLINHKVVRTEMLVETDDVYCMEVLGPDGEHDRHNFMVLGEGKDDVNTGTCVVNCKYGDFVLFVDAAEQNGILNLLPIPINEIEREEGYDKEDPFATRFRWLTQGNMILENWQIVHMRLLGNDNFLPYGSSVIEPSRRIWRQLILIEDAMLVYRLVRSPERRVFKIDIGNIPPDQVDSFMEQVKTTLRRTQVIDPNTGRVDLRYNPLSVDEDYFLPVRGDRSSTIETLAGGQFTGDIDDVQYIQNKLFAALKIPKAYLGYEGELGCLRISTACKLLDGTSPTVGEMLERQARGEEMWVYSVTKDGTFVPGLVSKVWATKEVDSLRRITLDNGTSVEVTDNHPFMLRNGTYRRADELRPGDSLMPITTEISSKAAGDFADGYEKVWDPVLKEWTFTHRRVAETTDVERDVSVSDPNEGYTIVHHKDFDKRNNSPVNLRMMGKKSHARLHAAGGQLLNMPETRDRLRETMETDEYRIAYHEGIVRAWNEDDGSRRAVLRADNERLGKSKLMRSALASRVTSGEVSFKGAKNGRWKPRPNFYAIVAQVRSGNWKMADVRDALGCSLNGILDVLKENGYSSWGHFVPIYDLQPTRKGRPNRLKEEQQAVSGNHRVVSVEIVQLAAPEWVYDIEVDNEHHNFAVAAGVYVHNSKATLAQQDVRFARTIERIQRIILSEMNKIAIIHLFLLGYNGPDLVNFNLKLAGSSVIFEQQKLELWRTRFEVASSAQEGILDRETIYKRIFNLSQKEIEGIREGKRADKLEDLTLESMQSPIPAEGEGGEVPGEGELPKTLGGAPGGEEGQPSGGGQEPPPEQAAPESVEHALALIEDSDDIEERKNRGSEGDQAELSAGRGKDLFSTGEDQGKLAFGTEKQTASDPYDLRSLHRLISRPFGESRRNREPVVSRKVFLHEGVQDGDLIFSGPISRTQSIERDVREALKIIASIDWLGSK